MSTLLHGPGCNLGNGRRCPLVVHYWVDLQSVHSFRCYDKIARTRNVSECLYSLYAWFLWHSFTERQFGQARLEIALSHHSFTSVAPRAWIRPSEVDFFRVGVGKFQGGRYPIPRGGGV